jgi:hypothetical protein
VRTVPGSAQNWIAVNAVQQFNLNKEMKTKNMTTLRFGTSIGRSPLRVGLLLIPLTLAFFALSPIAQAVSPAPDGGYPGGNTAEGQNALLSLTTGGFNTAVGFFSLHSDTTGAFNTGVGAGALDLNTGNENTATGTGALLLNTTGIDNVANGAFALVNNTTGTDNAAVGARALQDNTTGIFNTAVGFEALFSNTTGNNNTANGIQALDNNTTGGVNTAVGSSTLFNNTTGNNNTANGGGALVSNTTGNNNTASGIQALLSNTTGGFNTAVGSTPLFNNTTGNFNTATGGGALVNNTTGNGNIALGVGAGDNLTTGNNNIDIGNDGVVAEANTIRIGVEGTQTATFIAGVSGATVASGVTVIVGSDGHLGTIVSSARFKDKIKPMDKASEAILALKPVTFRYKKELDPKGIPQFGLVAEEVEKVNPDLVARDAKGKVYTVRYEAVNAMLLNEFLKEHREVAELKSIVVEQRKGMAAMAAQLTAQASQIQKVSAQLEASKPAPQVVSDNE